MSIIDEIKDIINLMDVVSKTTSVNLRKSGANHVGYCPFHNDKHKPNLVVYQNGSWNCFSCGEHGDVIDWVEKINPGWDKKEAIKHLANMAGIELRSDDTSVPERIAARKKESAKRVAMGIFKKWLLGEYDKGDQQTRAGDATALAYALDRGWTLGTIQNGGLVGFSGRATAAEYNEMRGEFNLNGIDLLSPEAVMVLGFKGDVAKWATEHEIDPKELSDNYIQGLMERPGLIYAHKFMGKIEYLSERFLPGYDTDRKSHNPPNALAGKRRAFRNAAYHHRLDGQEKGALLYIVEGQGCAKTFDQIHLPSVALCGSQWENLREDGEIEAWKNDYEEHIYVTDADTAGERVVTGKNGKYEMANDLGAMLWVGRTINKTWKRPDGSEKTSKDVNDIAQYLKDTQADEKTGNGLYNEIAMKAERIVVLAARYAGTLEGHAGEQMVEKIVRPMLLSIPAEKRVNYAADLARALYPKVSKSEATTAYNKWLRAQEKSAANVVEGETKLPEIETYGGWFRSHENKDSGYLVELYYDRDAEKLRLAWAHIKSLTNNEREIGWGKTLTLDNKILVPPVYDQLIQENIELHSAAIKFPTRVGDKVTTAEIIKKNAEFYKRYFYAEDKTHYKFCAVWSINTWVYDCFDTINMLRGMGPAGSGKSDFMYLVGLTSYRFAVTAATTTATSHVGLAKIYHVVDLVDEYDSALLRDDGSLAAYLKARPMRRLAHSFKMMEVMSQSGKTFVPSNTPIYGATMLTGYKKTKDNGIESRCMTFHLTKTDMITLDKNDLEPGYYPPELEQEAEETRNLCLRWRLENWMPRIELTADERKAHKLNDVLVDARTNQLFRAAKVMAIKQGDMDLFNDLFTLGRANFEDQLLEASGSFEAMVLRAALAADIAKDLELGVKPRASAAYAGKVSGYKDLVKVGKLGKHGVVRYILYKDLAKILNELFDLENIDMSDEEKKRQRKTQSKTAGNICHDAFRMPVERTGDGFVVVLNKDRLDIGRMRMGLDLENEYDPNYVGETESVEIPMPEPVQARLDDYVPSINAVWLDEYEEDME